MNENITTLINRIKEKDEEAFNEIYRIYYKQIYLYAYRLCAHNEADALEVIQETFTRVWNHIDQLKKPEAFTFWIKQIAHNACTKKFSKNKEILWDPGYFRQLHQKENRIDFNSHMKCYNEVDREIIYQCILNLPDRLQEIIHLFYLQQLSMNEIVDILKIPKGTVKSRIFNARKRLKEEIQKIEIQEERKISFYLKPVFPGVIALLLLQFPKLEKTTKGVQIVSIGACVCSAVLLINQSFSNIDTSPIKKELSVESQVGNEIEFKPITYKGKLITNAEEAYFTLLKEAPDQTYLNDKETRELQSYQPLIDGIIQSNTNYFQQLLQSGWLATYKENVQ